MLLSILAQVLVWDGDALFLPALPFAELPFTCAVRGNRLAVVFGEGVSFAHHVSARPFQKLRLFRNTKNRETGEPFRTRDAIAR